MTKETVFELVLNALSLEDKKELIKALGKRIKADEKAKEE